VARPSYGVLRNSFAAVLGLVALAACSQPADVPSFCTDATIELLDSRRQSTTAKVADPILFTQLEGGPRITVGRRDAEELLRLRSALGPVVAVQTERVRALLPRAESPRAPVDVDTLAPVPASGRMAQPDVLLRNEFMVLFLDAILSGRAQVGPASSFPTRLTIERFRATNALFEIRGVRARAGRVVVYEVCRADPILDPN
jgi:hypothetical protein